MKYEKDLDEKELNKTENEAIQKMEKIIKHSISFTQAQHQHHHKNPINAINHGCYIFIYLNKKKRVKRNMCRGNVRTTHKNACRNVWRIKNSY